MGRKEQVKRSAEQKWEILQEGLKSGNVAETCRKHGVAPNLWYRWRDEAEAGAKAALGGRSAAGGADQGANGDRRDALHSSIFRFDSTILNDHHFSKTKA
jgi:transposase-like protein